MGDQPSPSEHKPSVDLALAIAWRNFDTFDREAQREKNNSWRIRQWIILGSFFASFLAVLVSHPLFRDIEFFRIAFQLLLIVLPIFVASALRFAAQFSPSARWIAFRVGAERIRRNIYLYRMHAGEYAPGKPPQNGEPVLSPRDCLMNNLEAARKQAILIGGAAPFLQEAVAFTDAQIAKLDPQDAKYKPLDIESYINDRIMYQLQYYVPKSKSDNKVLKSQNVWILVMTAFGSVLAAIGQPSFVAVTTAWVAALVLNIDLKMLGYNYGIYQLTANDLQGRIDRWRVDTSEGKPDKAVETAFVQDIERIFELESDTWMQQALKVQSDLDATLRQNSATLSDQRGQKPSR